MRRLLLKLITKALLSFVCFLIPIVSFSQVLALENLDSLQIKKITELGICTITRLSCDQDTKTVSMTRQFDLYGNSIMNFNSLGKRTYEYDSVGRLTKAIVYDREDTSHIKSCSLYKYDSSGVVQQVSCDSIGTFFRDKRTQTRKEGSLTYIQVYTYTKSKLKQQQSLTIVHPQDLHGRSLTHYIIYNQFDNISEIITLYYKRDVNGNLIEIGELDYHRGMMDYTRANKLNPYYYIQNKSAFAQMILSQQFEGEEKAECIYTYDSLNNIIKSYEHNLHYTFTYNSAGQLYQFEFTQFEKKYIHTYEYNKEGLVVKEKLTNDFGIVDDYEYIYEYCK